MPSAFFCVPLACCHAAVDVQVGALRQRVIAPMLTWLIRCRRIAVSMRVRVAQAQQQRRRKLPVHETVADIEFLVLGEERITIVLVLRVAVRSAERERSDRVLACSAGNTDGLSRLVADVDRRLEQAIRRRAVPTAASGGRTACARVVHVQVAGRQERDGPLVYDAAPDHVWPWPVVVRLLKPYKPSNWKPAKFGETYLTALLTRSVLS